MDVVAGRAFADERRPIRHVDWLLLVITVGLSVVGLFLLYSATNQTLRQDGLDPFARVNKQAFTIGLGLRRADRDVAAVDYRFFKVYAGFIYLGVACSRSCSCGSPGSAPPTRPAPHSDGSRSAACQITPVGVHASSR